MKKNCFIFCFLLACSLVSAQVPSPSTPRLLFEDGTYLGKDNPMPISGDIEVGSFTVEALPSYKDSTGTATRALVDSEDRVIVNLASETIGLKDAIDLVTAEIEASGVNASETVLISAIDLVETAVDNSNDAISGIAAAARTLSVTTASAVSIGDIGTARTVYIYSDKDVNFGGSGIATGLAAPFIPGGAPFVKFRFTSATPDFYFIGRSETATVQIWEADE